MREWKKWALVGVCLSLWACGPDMPLTKVAGEPDTGNQEDVSPDVVHDFEDMTSGDDFGHVDTDDEGLDVPNGDFVEDEVVDFGALEDVGPDFGDGPDLSDMSDLGVSEDVEEDLARVWVSVGDVAQELVWAPEEGAFVATSPVVEAGLWQVKVEVSEEGQRWWLWEAGAGLGLGERELEARSEDGPGLRLWLPGRSRLALRVEGDLALGARLTWDALELEVEAPVWAPGLLPWERRGAGALAWAVREMDGLSDDGARRAFWEQWREALAQAGALQVMEDRSVTLVFYDVVPDEAALSGPFEVGASWNAWDSAALPMDRVDGTRFHVATQVIEGEFRGQYKLVYVPEESWFQDPGNALSWWDGFNLGGVGNFNSELRFGATPGQGRLVQLRGVVSEGLGNARDVWVYVPDGVSSAGLPVVVFHDGNESLTRADFAGQLDVWHQAHPGRPFLGVFVGLARQDERLAEYTFGTPESRGDAYRDFVTESLLPAIERDFGAGVAPSVRAIMGMSLGGLVSYYIGLTGEFGRVGGMSSSFFWNESQMLGLYGEGELVPLDACYLDSGSPRDNFDVTRDMAQVLERRGYEVTYVVEEGAGHEWSAWQGRLQGALEVLVP